MFSFGDIYLLIGFLRSQCWVSQTRHLHLCTPSIAYRNAGVYLGTLAAASVKYLCASDFQPCFSSLHAASITALTPRYCTGGLCIQPSNHAHSSSMHSLTTLGSSVACRVASVRNFVAQWLLPTVICKIFFSCDALSTDRHVESYITSLTKSSAYFDRPRYVFAGAPSGKASSKSLFEKTFSHRVHSQSAHPAPSSDCITICPNSFDNSGESNTQAGRQNPCSRHERGKHSGHTVAPSKSRAEHREHVQRNFFDSTKYRRRCVRDQNWVPR
mmetsp:Transcript_44393/g.74022  ORF Transcript_44393/g.74022 Transcript_44393/m.74022 type:complete len:271 (+) Transcript_44393:271-1083(+)